MAQKFKVLDPEGITREIEIEDGILNDQPHLYALLSRLNLANNADSYERSYEKSRDHSKEHDRTPSHGNGFSKAEG